MPSEIASSVNRELERIGLHVKHAKEFMQMGLPYSEDLLGELTQISNICQKAVGKVEDDVKRADTLESQANAPHYFDGILDEDPLAVSTD
ncbi:MAG TPA: hypothetical protein VFF07_06385 [Actinomycetota bacterium]|nr:hypothetical protein [Actinomycetota bacterium]